MIRTRPVTITPTYTHDALHGVCAAMGRLSENLAGLKRLVGADLNAEYSSTEHTLDGMLSRLIDASDSLTITETIEDEDPPKLEIVMFDEKTGLVFISAFIGEMRDTHPFFERFQLSADERSLIDEGTLCHIFALIPEGEGNEPIPAVAMLALGDDGWEYDGYTLPLELRVRLLIAGRQALATM